MLSGIGQRFVDGQHHIAAAVRGHREALLKPPGELGPGLACRVGISLKPATAKCGGAVVGGICLMPGI